MTSPHLPTLLIELDLAEVYGLNLKTIWTHRRRGLIASPDARSRLGDLWDAEAITRSRVTPRADLAAIAPVDPILGETDLGHHRVYLCPDQSGSHIGWANPAILGTYQRGGIVTWHDVVGIARYEAGAGTPSTATSHLTAAQIRRANNAVAARDTSTYPAAAFILGTKKLGQGPVDAGRSANGNRLGLRQGRVLKVDHTANAIRVGAPNHWLTLAGGTLPNYTLPDLNTAWPATP